MSQGFNPPSGGSFGSPSGGQSGFGTSHGGFSAGSGNSGGFGGFGAGPAAGGSFGGGDSGFSAPSFDSAPVASRKRGITKAPVEKLIPSLVLASIGIVLNVWLLISDQVATDTSFLIFALVAWVLSGIIGISALSWYFKSLNEKKANGIFSDEPGRKAFFYLTAVALLIAVVWSAFNIAQFFGKL